MSTLAGALKCPRRSWKPCCQVWEVVASVIAKRQCAVWVAYGVHAQDFGYSSMQLWGSWDFCESGRKYAVRRLVATCERFTFCSYCVGLYSSALIRRRGWVASVSACQTCHAGSNAALAQLGRLWERQQICGEETRYHLWKKHVLFLLRRFVLISANKASWLSGQRVRPSNLLRGFDSLFRCIFSFFLSPRPCH